jgi:hypothetical protein
MGVFGVGGAQLLFCRGSAKNGKATIQQFCHKNFIACFLLSLCNVNQKKKFA